jgi:sensor histidine kinase YesM
LVVIFFRQKVLKNKQTQLETEQRLNRARMNPHFFFNTLSALQTSALKEKDPLKLADLLSKYSRIMRSTLESTYEDLVSVEDEEQYLLLYLQLQQYRCNDSFTFSIAIDEQIERSEVLLPGMILQPFVENAIEHGFAGIERGGKIDISFGMQNAALVITITDNGAGIADSGSHKEHKSRATEITRDRLSLLNKKHKSHATFAITSNSGKPGTTVTLTLPLLK